MDDRRARVLREWLAVLVGAIAVSALFWVIGLPSAPLFGALVAGLVRALSRPAGLQVPRRVGAAAQAVIGVSIGSLVQTETLRTVAEHWLARLLVTFGTLGESLLAGRVVRLYPGLRAG